MSGPALRLAVELDGEAPIPRPGAAPPTPPTIC